jgi:hypothetical protein
MANRRHSGQTWARRSATILTLLCIVTLAAGCSQNATVAQQNHDPLHGIMTPPGVPQPGSNAKGTQTPLSAPQAQQASGVPVMPTSLTSSNTATLAGKTGQGAWSRHLAIDDEGRPVTPKPGFAAPNANPKVELVPDLDPNLKPASTGTWQAPTIPATGGAPAGGLSNATDETLFKQLQQRGILQQKQDPAPGGIRLTCYASRGPEGGLRIYEVTAADYASAAQAILQQLDGPR